MANAIVEKAKERMTHSHQSLAREFGSIRAGRANASLLDRIHVEVLWSRNSAQPNRFDYDSGSACSFGDTFDKSSIKDIERALNASDLGCRQRVGGSVIRLVIPALTEETRRDLTKK